MKKDSMDGLAQLGRLKIRKARDLLNSEWEVLSSKEMWMSLGLAALVILLILQRQASNQREEVAKLNSYIAREAGLSIEVESFKKQLGERVIEAESLRKQLGESNLVIDKINARSLDSVRLAEKEASELRAKLASAESVQRKNKNELDKVVQDHHEALVEVWRFIDDYAGDKYESMAAAKIKKKALIEALEKVNFTKPEK